MDNQNNSTTTTFLPPPIDGEASAPLAQPDDDFVVPLSAAGTPNTPADDGGTGSTVSPVSPVHLNRQQHGAMMIDDDQAANTAADSGATDDSSVLLPPPDETDNEEKPNKVNADDEDDEDNGGGDNNDEAAADDDDQVPVLAMSGILPATATGGAPIPDSKKNAGGPNDSLTCGGAGTGSGENKSKEKSRYTTGSGTGTGTDADDSGTSNPQAALGCGTMFEYVVLVTACSILLLAVTGTTIYWTMAYRGGYDITWFPWPPLTPREMLSGGVFTYKHPQNFTTGGNDISTTISTTTVQQSSQLNISSSNVSIEDLRFNLHPTLMTIGFVTFTGFSILVYRFAVGCSTSCMGIYVKLSHVVLHLATAPCILLGAVAAMEYHRLKGLPHMYSLHSWMGLLTCILFTIQFTLGFFTFVLLLCCRSATVVCRLRCFAPIHATLGLCTFTLAIATCLTGLQQRADFSIFSNNNGQQQQQKQHQQQQTTPTPTPSSLNSGEHGRALPQQAIINIIGVLLMITLVFVTVTLLSQKKSCRRNSSSSFSPSTMRYCRNGGQSFQLVPSSPAAADGSDHGGRNGRM